MRDFLKRLALYTAVAATLLAFVPGLATRAMAQAGLTVESIEFEGNKRFSSDTVRLNLRTKVGEKFDRALLNEDVNALYKFFDTVEVDEKSTPDGIRLTFVVTENPIVSEVVFRGVVYLSETQLRKEIETAQGLPLAEHRLANDVSRIVRMYKLAGFHFAEVQTETSAFGEGRQVVFNVFEGPEVMVDEIRIVGNASIPSAELIDNIATEETGFLRFLGGKFVEQTLLQDILTMKNYYRREGWLSAEVRLEGLDFSADKDDVIINLAVDEGPAYTVGEVAIEGADNYPGGVEVLRPLLRVKTGERRRIDDLTRSITNIENAYREEGYASVLVDFTSKETDDGVSDLTFRVRERAKVRARNVDILGNTITKDKVIRRELTVYPGGVLNANEIRKSENRLRGLGYFPRVQARIKELEDGQDPDLKDVVFEVDDTGRTGQVRFAIGFSSDLGAVASIAVTKRNFDWQDWPEKFSDILGGRAFTGGGQTFQLELSPGSQFSNYRLAFTEPWLFDKPISFGWDLFMNRFSRFDYDVDRRGAHLTLGRRWTYHGKEQDSVVSFSGTTRLEKVDVSAVDDDSAPTAFLSEGDNSLLSEKLTIKLDRTDRQDSPTNGWFGLFSTEFGLGGDIQLWRNELEAKSFWVVARNEDDRDHIFSIGARLGHVAPLSGSDRNQPNLLGGSTVPVYERYFAGGGSSSAAIRGFEYGGAGPHGQGDPHTTTSGSAKTRRLQRIQQGRTALSMLENDGDPIGGNVLAVASAEYTFPLYEEVLRGVLFLDAGVVRDSWSRSHGLNKETLALAGRLNNGTTREKRLGASILREYDEGDSFFSDVRVSVGFGLRVKIAAFGQQPIALDFGFPIRDQSGDDTQVLSFSIARDF